VAQLLSGGLSEVEIVLDEQDFDTLKGVSRMVRTSLPAGRSASMSLGRSRLGEQNTGGDGRSAKTDPVQGCLAPGVEKIDVV
jgi:hypothetical protein